MNEDNLKILFIHSGMPAFARTDFDILADVHDVREFNFPSIQHGWYQVIRHLPALWHGVQGADMTFSWFGKLHAFFAVLFSKMLGKKAIVVVSGGEICRFSFADGRYQSLCTQPIKRWLPRYVARRADLLLAVSNYAYNEAIVSVNADPRRMKMIYHGFDLNLFCRPDNMIKNGSVVSVGEVIEENLYRKMFLEFVAAANLSLDIPFVLIGAGHDGTMDKLKESASANVTVTGFIPDEDLINRLYRASVYVQASVFESFGCALAEAMACECVPVVTRIPVLEEVVGDCGIYLDDPVTPKEIAEKVRVALQHPELGKRARQRIIDKFPLEKRKEKVLESVEFK